MATNFINYNYSVIIVDKCVDFTILADYNEQQHLVWSYFDEKQKQWIEMFEPIIDYLSPDVLYYEDNPELQRARSELLNAYGVEGCIKKRGEEISTSEIIEKIRQL